MLRQEAGRGWHINEIRVPVLVHLRGMVAVEPLPVVRVDAFALRSNQGLFPLHALVSSRFDIPCEGL